MRQEKESHAIRPGSTVSHRFGVVSREITLGVELEIRDMFSRHGKMHGHEVHCNGFDYDHATPPILCFLRGSEGSEAALSFDMRGKKTGILGIHHQKGPEFNFNLRALGREIQTLLSNKRL